MRRDFAIKGIQLAVRWSRKVARVALGDEISDMLGARMIAMLVGERPGLSAPDSLGAYLTYAPRVGLTDERAQLRIEYPRRRPEL